MKKRKLGVACGLLFVLATGILSGCMNTSADGTQTEINTLMETGDSQYEDGLFADSIASYDAVLKLDNVYTDALINKARSEVELGQLSSAKQDMISARATLESESAPYLEVEGMIAWKEKKRDQAITSFSNAIKIAPSADLYSNRGHVYYELHKNDDAKKDIDQAISLDKTNADNYHVLAQLSVDYNDFKHAKEYAETAFNLDKTDVRNQAIIGYSMYKLIPENASDEEKTKLELAANAQLDAANKTNEKEPVVYNYMGLIQADKGEYKNAEDLYKKAIELNKEEATFFNNRAIAYYNQQKNGEAMSDINTAITLDPLAAEYYLGRGYILTTQEQYENAARDFKKAYELDKTIKDRIPNDVDLGGTE